MARALCERDVEGPSGTRSLQRAARDGRGGPPARGRGGIARGIDARRYEFLGTYRTRSAVVFAGPVTFADGQLLVTCK